MSRDNKFLAIAVALSATLLVSSAAAKNGVEKYEFDIHVPAFYIACLGEHVEINVSVTGKYHEFDTSSGKYHLIDNWQYTWEFSGLLTERTWIGRGATPLVVNIGPGEASQWGESMVARPLTGDGPKFRYFYRFKATVNANGELVVLIDDLDGVDPGDYYQCIGKQ